MNSFECFLLSDRHQSDFIDEQLLADWYLSLRCNGITFKTAGFYLNILSGLYKALRIKKNLPEDEIFRSLRLKIKKYDNPAIRLSFSQKSLDSLFRNSSDREEAIRDIILISLSAAQFSLSEIAGLRKDEIESLPTLPGEIARYHISPLRKYVFPLDRTKYTERQFRLFVEDLAVRYLEKNNLLICQSAENSLKTLWGYIALDSGLSPAVVLSILEEPPLPLSLLKITGPTQLSESQRQKIISEVAATFNSEKRQWYALQLRQGVRYPEFRKKLALFSGTKEVDTIKLFYPLEEITRKVGHKIILEEKPILGNIVFFESRPRNVAPLFRRIWESAWCFRDFSSPGSPYAVIKESEMENFKRAIGWLSPEVEITPSEATRLQPGEKVVILDGNFFNREAEILKRETNKDNGKTIYRVRLTDSSGKWLLSLDARSLRKL